ncbi:hypothetical protein MTR_4g077703 [Medicago truncatula]|uniref:Uncharacterized protein n=1 Tax=Medicago truncatula TaxID=3880 RepID=A0A072ULJ8_MEDTR|nr:hypothetical protein MTR_4g077703 [Medicago truncatula]
MIQELFLESKMIFVHEVSASDRSLTFYPPIHRSVVQSSNNAELDGEQVSSEQAQKQFVIPGGPMNASSSPVQSFYVPPSQTHAAHMTYGEGSQLGAQTKLQNEVAGMTFGYGFIF